MHLYLTSYEPWNSTYCTQDGKALYKVECPYKMRAQTATISRALPDLKPTSEELLWAERHFPAIEEHHHHRSTSTHMHDDFEIQEERRKSFESHDHEFHWGSPPLSCDDVDKIAKTSKTENRFIKLAEIEFHTISSTRIRYLGNEWKASEFFRKEGWGWYGSNRIFTGPDGKEYRWKMGSSISELFLQDADENVKDGKAHVPVLVARLHNPHFGVVKKGPASLEIFPAGEHMVDLILITFIYIEKMRRDRQISAARSATTNGSAASMAIA